MSWSAIRVAVSITGLATVFAASAQQMTTPVSASSIANIQRPVVKPGDRQCLRSTGSVVPAKAGTCLPVTGSSYSQQELQNTGEQNIGPALRKLDPSITLEH